MKKVLIVTVSIIIIVLIIILLQNDKRENTYKLSQRSSSSSMDSEFRNAQRAVEYYNEQIREHPQQIKNYIELAQLFMQESRVTGRHHEYIPKAERLNGMALDIDPDNFDALITQSAILTVYHQFDKAKVIIEKAISKNPYNAYAYGILCDVNVELGLYDDAVKACDKMLGIHPDLRSYSRASYIRELHGDIPGAIDAMILAADAGVYGQENRAWALYNLGTLYLNMNKSDTAAFIFNGILEERPNYSYAIYGLSMVYLSQKNYSKALEFLFSASQSNPDHLFTERIAYIYKITGQKQAEAEMLKKVIETFEQHQDDGYNISLEYSRFCLKHDINVSESLELISDEYKSRPANIDVLDVYAWALYKNGKVSEAVPIIKEALRLKTNRSELFYHAAMIFKSVNNELAYHYMKKAENSDLSASFIY